MSISDDLMWRYYELLTDLMPAEIDSLRKSAQSGERNPRDIKVELAKSIIGDFHSLDDATQAEEEFNRVFRSKQTPDEVEEVSLDSGLWKLPRLLVDAGLALSVAEARRLIEQGGVSLNGEKQLRYDLEISVTPEPAVLIQVGKRKFRRVRGA